MKNRKIIISFEYPPIPLRTMDYCAYDENHVEDTNKYGWGSTPSEALRNLADILEEE